MKLNFLSATGNKMSRSLSINKPNFSSNLALTVVPAMTTMFQSAGACLNPKLIRELKVVPATWVGATIFSSLKSCSLTSESVTHMNGTSYLVWMDLAVHSACLTLCSGHNMMNPQFNCLGAYNLYKLIPRLTSRQRRSRS